MPTGADDNPISPHRAGKRPALLVRFDFQTAVFAMDLNRRFVRRLELIQAVSSRARFHFLP